MLMAKATRLLAEIPQQSSNILLERVDGIEECGRPWEAVSFIEFTSWIGDMALLKQGLSKISADKKEVALAQIKSVRDNGLEHGKHMAPFRALRDACVTYKDLCRASEFKTGREKVNCCIQIFGKCELLLSLFGLQQLCDTARLCDIARLAANVRPLQRELRVKGVSLLPLSDSFIGKGAGYIFPNKFNVAGSLSDEGRVAEVVATAYIWRGA